MNIVRRHIVFTGWVQGVGFRYRACHAASLCSCTGWVKNEWDGSVTMEIQGEPEQIEAALEAIQRGRYIHIEGMAVKNLPPLPDERGFRTEY